MASANNRGFLKKGGWEQTGETEALATHYEVSSPNPLSPVPAGGGQEASKVHPLSLSGPPTLLLGQTH